MTREQLLAQFPDATDEQINAILGINGTEIQEAKKGNVDSKELKRLRENDAAYQKLVDANLTDAEKVQKALDDANTTKSEYTKKMNRLEAEKILVAAGLTEEEYGSLIEKMVSEDMEDTKTSATAFATLISSQKETAMQKAKEALMDGTHNSGGQGADGDKGNQKTEAEKIVENIASKNSEGAKAAEAANASYFG